MTFCRAGRPQPLMVLNDGLRGAMPNPGPLLLDACQGGGVPEWLFKGSLKGFLLTPRHFSKAKIRALAENC